LTTNNQKFVKKMSKKCQKVVKKLSKKVQKAQLANCHIIYIT
jgi:hypothetical protein